MSFSSLSAHIFLLNSADGAYVSKKREPVSCHSLILTDIEGRVDFGLDFNFNEKKRQNIAREDDKYYSR